MMITFIWLLGFLLFFIFSSALSAYLSYNAADIVLYNISSFSGVLLIIASVNKSLVVSYLFSYVLFVIIATGISIFLISSDNKKERIVNNNKKEDSLHSEDTTDYSERIM